MIKERRDRRDREREEDPIKEKLIHVNRVAKVVKGGRRFSFSALVVVGDANGSVGLGFGKANEVAEAIRKGIQDGKNNMFKVSMKGTSIPYEIMIEDGAARVLLKPARPGTGLIAGGAVRSIMERAGIKDIVTKNLGTKNQINSAKATIKGLKSLKSAEQFAELKMSASKKRDRDGDDEIEVITEDDKPKRQQQRSSQDQNQQRRRREYSGRDNRDNRPPRQQQVPGELHPAPTPAAAPVAEAPTPAGDGQE